MAKKRRKKNIKTINIAGISGLLTLIIGFTFMIVYFLGERFGFAPIITLGAVEWLSSGEAVIIFMVILLASVFIGSFIVLNLIKKV